MQLNSLVSFRSWNLFAVIIQHGHITPVIRSSQSNYLIFPMPFLAHELINFIVKVPNLIIRKPSYTKLVMAQTIEADAPS